LARTGPIPVPELVDRALDDQAARDHAHTLSSTRWTSASSGLRAAPFANADLILRLDLVETSGGF
jgi:hypothetical protein